MTLSTGQLTLLKKCLFSCNLSSQGKSILICHGMVSSFNQTRIQGCGIFASCWESRTVKKLWSDKIVMEQTGTQNTLWKRRPYRGPELLCKRDFHVSSLFTSIHVPHVPIPVLVHCTYTYTWDSVAENAIGSLYGPRTQRRCKDIYMRPTVKQQTAVSHSSPW